MKNAILSWGFVLLTSFLFGCSSSTTENKMDDLTLMVPFKCNAYVTPLDPLSKTPPSFANQIIVNKSQDPYDAEMTKGSWKASYYKQEPHQISIFFYSANVGNLKLGLMANQTEEGESELKVKIGSQSHSISFKDGAETEKYVGEYQIMEPGYIRVDIEPVTTTASSYPSIKGLKLGGDVIGGAAGKVAGKIMFVAASDLVENRPHFVRRGPSNHFQWDTPEGTEFFYNEVFVPEGEDVPGAYFMLTGGSGFYMGIQPNTKGKDRSVLFSVWDTDTEKGQVSELVRNGEGVKSNNYSHEGSGVQNFYYYDWEAGRTYATLVRVRPEIVNGKATGASLYTGYFRGDEGWVFLAEVRRPALSTYYKGAYSFSENFRPEYGWVTRSVMFPSQWMRDKDGNWHELVSGRVTCDGTARQGLRRDYEGGVNKDGLFYLRNIGYIPETVEYGTRFTRQPSGKQPDIDIQALVELSKSEDQKPAQ